MSVYDKYYEKGIKNMLELVKKIITDRVIRECILEVALKNSIVIYLVEMGMGVYIYGFRFLYVGVGRSEKRKWWEDSS